MGVRVARTGSGGGGVIGEGSTYLVDSVLKLG